MNIEFHVILDSNVVEYITALCEFMTAWLFPILTKTNYLLLMGEMLSFDSLCCKVQEISFEHTQKPDSIKSRRNWGILWKNCKGHFFEIWESSSLSYILVSIPWTTDIYLFSKQKILWAKRTNIILIFFISMSLLSYHLSLKKCEESNTGVTWQNYILNCIWSWVT